MNTLLKSLVPVAALLAGDVCAADAVAATLPGDSIYQVTVALTDQAGKPAPLDRYAGQPTIVSMFYSSCPHVCPMLVSSVQRLEKELPAAQRGRLRVLFVSLDPADTPKALQEVVARHGIDTTRWSLVRTSADEVRQVAAALGVRYRQLPDGSFSHSTILTLLDAQGRPLRRTESFTDPEPEFRAALLKATTE